MSVPPMAAAEYELYSATERSFGLLRSRSLMGSATAAGSVMRGMSSIVVGAARRAACARCGGAGSTRPALAMNRRADIDEDYDVFLFVICSSIVHFLLLM